MLKHAVPTAPPYHPPHGLPSATSPTFDEPDGRPPASQQQERFVDATRESISRPSSTQSITQLYRSASGASAASLESFHQQALPPLERLASLAASVPAAATPGPGNNGERSSTPHHMNAPPQQFAPAATAGGQQQGPPVCANCSTSTTPLWRRDESGAILCNACGLFLKLHGKSRPISLKTDVIKSRNRVKTAAPRRGRESLDGPTSHLHAPPMGGSYPAAHPDAHSGHYGMQHFPADPNARAPSPQDRSGTPSQQHGANIAPPHIFDSVSLPSDSFASPSLAAFVPARQPTPNGNHHHPSLNRAESDTGQLTTRISELEVINDLFRGRVAQLEQAERSAREEARAKDEEMQRERSELTAARTRIAELEARVAELESARVGETEPPPRKRTRRNPELEEGQNDTKEG